MDAGILAEIVPAMLKALIAGNPGSELIVFTTIILVGKLYLAIVHQDNCGIFARILLKSTPWPTSLCLEEVGYDVIYPGSQSR